MRQKHNEYVVPKSIQGSRGLRKVAPPRPYKLLQTYGASGRSRVEARRTDPRAIYNVDAVFVIPHHAMVNVPACIRHSTPITMEELTPRSASACRKLQFNPNWLRIRDFHSFHHRSAVVSVTEQCRN